jgi:predicted nucleic acid-binding Zn ribbon protein
MDKKEKEDIEFQKWTRERDIALQAYYDECKRWNNGAMLYFVIGALLLLVMIFIDLQQFGMYMFLTFIFFVLVDISISLRKHMAWQKLDALGVKVPVDFNP